MYRGAGPLTLLLAPLREHLASVTPLLLVPLVSDPPATPSEQDDGLFTMEDILGLSCLTQAGSFFNVQQGS